MKPREFHIWQFPEEIRLLFRNNKEFVEGICKSFGSREKLAKFLKIPPINISQWKKYPLYIPLKHIKKIVRELELNWVEVERNIISYKGINTSSPVTNPNLPIKENPEIFALMTHIICDGCVNKNGIPFYTNSNKVLINNINNILKDNFGDMNSKLYYGKGINKNCWVYRFPKVITDLLEHFYKIKLYKADQFPQEIFDLPKEFAVSIIKAFADDESHVDLNKRIVFYSTSQKLLKSLIKLLKEKLFFENIGPLINKEENYYYFYIKSKDIKKYKKIIGFNHPKKQKRLNIICKINKKPGMRGKNGETRERLLNILNNNVLSTYQIIEEIKINKNNINMQIKKLQKQNLIVQSHKTGNVVFWTRKNK